MKRLMVTSLVLLAGISGGAMAIDCTNQTQIKSGLSSILQGKTICAVMNGNQKWAEYHSSNGDLVDYKKGPPSPTNIVDPQKKVGTWSVVGSGNGTQVKYDYGTGGSYFYEVHVNNSGVYTICGITNGLNLDVTLLLGQVSCGF